MKMSSSTKDGEIKKFLFDHNDFDNVEADAPVAPVFSEEQLITAREQAYAMGRQEGLNESLLQQEEAIRKNTTHIGDLLATLLTAEDQREMEKCMDATRLALHIVHKMLPQLTLTHGLAEIERVILQSIDSRRDEPRIAITVPTTHLEALRANIDKEAQARGFAGKVILLADDNMAPSDCRVEWADGGSERLAARLLMQIESEFTKALAGMHSLLPSTKPDNNEK